MAASDGQGPGLHRTDAVVPRRLLAGTLGAALLLAGVLDAPAAAVPGCTDPGQTARYSGGTGDPGDPYLIASVGDLIALRDRVNLDEEDQEFCVFEQTVDLDLGSAGTWVAIGTNTTSSRRFLGTFDGGYRAIDNLTITTVDPAVTYYGLFGYVRHGTLSNLRLSNVRIDLTFDEVSGSRYVGAVAGRMESSSTSSPLTTLERSSVQGDVTVRYSGNDDVYVGGLVGRARTNAVLDDRLAFIGTLRGAYGTTGSNRDGNFGGLVGRTSQNASLSVAYVWADVRIDAQPADGSPNRGSLLVGLLTGSSSSQKSDLAEMYATGRVSIRGDVGDGIGAAGVVGFIENQEDEFIDLYYEDTIGRFDGRRVDDYATAGLIVTTLPRAQMQGVQPASTMLRSSGTTRWRFANVPGAPDADGTWYLVLDPAGFPVFDWEVNAIPADSAPPAFLRFLTTPAPADAGPTLALACTPDALRVGTVVTCTITGGGPGIDILWHAAYNPVFAGAGVTLDEAGVGSFSFTVPRAALGSALTVELVEWTDPMQLGIVEGPTPASIPSGGGAPPVLPAAMLGLLGLLGFVAVRNLRRPVTERPTGMR